MMIRIVFFLLVLSSFLSCSYNQIEIKKGLTITESAIIKAGSYLITSNDQHDPIVTIEGNDITVDFNFAVLSGSDTTNLPDEYKGLGILVKGGSNVKIKNLVARGFKVALMAEGTSNLTIENCDLSYNYRPRLNSTQQAEDISDWMSYHHNDNNEWLRYGAALYLVQCHNASILNNIAMQGQNALMMTRCNNSTIANNRFAFNSGIGLGMYLSSNNVVAFNNLNFNVRGYSDSVYHRGQDSAGILVYEQSNGNVFYKNSATHSGDGFFLWAGQTTMDSGKGGCNDNVLLENDFSYAPTNGIEVTFSRNIISGNKLEGCDHGIWGGYSYESKIINNAFSDNRIDIAIEHGQQNQIALNKFRNSEVGIKLWQRKTQPSDWGYAKNRDTKSHGYTIFSNIFRNVVHPFQITDTDDLRIINNTLSNLYLGRMGPGVTNIDTVYNPGTPFSMDVNFSDFIPAIEQTINPFEDSARFKGRNKIRMTAWGPYRYDYPILWHTNPIDSGRQMNFEILGPKGNWKILGANGLITLTSIEGTVPQTIIGNKRSESVNDVEIELEFIGEEFTDPFGKVIPKNTPYRFQFRKFFQPVDFTVNWFDVDTTMYNPLSRDGLFPANVRVRPFKTEQTDRLDYAWWGGIKTGEEVHQQFLTVAEGKATMLAGRYEFGITWDDAVRVFIDDSLLVDEWKTSVGEYDESPHRNVIVNLSEGLHRIRVEHLELGGMASLALKIKKLD